MSDTNEFSREAFMAAIVKLADDEGFRRSFLTHYQLWLHPPMMVTPDLEGVKFNFAPGGITYLSEEQMDEMRHRAITGFECANGVLREIKDPS